MVKISMKELEIILRQKGIRPSYLRIKVLEYFFKYHNHPSVWMLYDGLQDKIPTLSKTSVYNTLNLFIQHKIIESVGVLDNEQRYDLFRSQAHAHFHCDQCLEISDINLDIDYEIGKVFEQYEVTHQSLQFRGICPRCLQKNKIE
ncbi:MAG: Fur family transcriptional regulator [Culicoidibacterales bacterium]